MGVGWSVIPGIANFVDSDDRIIEGSLIRCSCWLSRTVSCLLPLSVLRCEESWLVLRSVFRCEEDGDESVWRLLVRRVVVFNVGVVVMFAICFGDGFGMDGCFLFPC